MPIQKQVVQSLVSWDRIEARLDRYPAIRDAFPLRVLQQYDDREPFFCHYMTWRLGTWTSEAPFRRLDELLILASSLENWAAERPLLRTAEFGDFWSLVWQLQMAEYLQSVGTHVHWLGSGPDLAVRLGGEKVFVECLSYRKAFDILEFLREVVAIIAPEAHISHPLFLPVKLPQGHARTSFIDRALVPLQDQELMTDAREEARRRYPVIVSPLADHVSIRIDGPASSDYDPSTTPPSGDPERHLAAALRETIAKKQDANRLGSYRPNVLAVNMLVTDAQVAILVRPDSVEVSLEDLPGPIDAVAVAALGIDQRLERQAFVLASSRSAQHPFSVASIPPHGSE